MSSSKAQGSIRHSDPEYLNDIDNYKRTKASDVYSIGMLLWVISSGRIPFESDQTDISLALAIVGGKREAMVKGTPSKYFEIYTGIYI